MPPGRVYVMHVEVRPGPKAQLRDAAGAFVNCYVRASSVRSAHAKIRAALTEDDYQVLEAEKCGIAADMEWLSPDGKREASRAIRLAENSDDVVYGTFHAYDRDSDE